jgi:hypothetical protein
MIVFGIVLMVAGFCPDTTLQDPDAYDTTFDNVDLTWAVDDSFADWSALIPGLNNVPGSPQYYRDNVMAIVDKVSQDWSRLGRSRTKVAFGSWVTTTVPAATSRIYFVGGNCPNGTQAVAGQGPGVGNIEIRRNCNVPFVRAAGNADANGGELNTTLTAERLLAHEMGHIHGASHPNACLAGENGTGALMVNRGNRRTDVPAPDDVEAHHRAMQGGVFELPRRTIFLTKSSFSTAGVLTEAGQIEFNGSAAFPARIECPPNAVLAAGPHCFMARNYTGEQVRMTRLVFPGANPTTFTTGLTTSYDIKSNGSADIAVGGNTVVMIVNETGVFPMIDGSLVNEVRIVGPRVLRFDRATGALLPNLQVVASPGVELVSALEPRVAFAPYIGLDSCNIVGAPCTSPSSGGVGICQANNICTSAAMAAASGRFVVAVVKANRQLSLYLSANNAREGSGATPVYTPITITGTLSAIDNSFDIACPRHFPTAVTGATLAAARRCRIVFPPASTASEPDKIESCTLTLSANGLTAAVSGCSLTSLPMWGPSVSSVSDYGIGQPTTQLQGHKFLVANSRALPHSYPGNYIFRAADDAGTTITSGANSYALTQDAITCTSLTNGDVPKSYFGDVSADYCDFCDRILTTKMGAFVSPSSYGTECR